MNILKVFTDKRVKGNIGEDAVCRYLRRRHYKILERNFVARGHEIDIIAENKHFLCFVEVKARTASKMREFEARPASAVNTEKMRSIISVAKYYTAAEPETKRVRFDVAEVYLSDDKSVERIEYIESAFTYDNTKRR